MLISHIGSLKGKLNIFAAMELNPYIHFDPPNFKAKVFMYVDVVPCKLGLDFTSSNRPFNEILQLGYLLWKSHKSCHQKYANWLKLYICVFEHNRLTIDDYNILCLGPWNILNEITQVMYQNYVNWLKPYNCVFEHKRLTIDDYNILCLGTWNILNEITQVMSPKLCELTQTLQLCLWTQ